MLESEWYQTDVLRDHMRRMRRLMCCAMRVRMPLVRHSHPRGNPGANLESIFHRSYLRKVAFEWELTQQTIYLPLGCLQGGQKVRPWHDLKRIPLFKVMVKSNAT